MAFPRDRPWSCASPKIYIMPLVRPVVSEGTVTGWPTMACNKYALHFVQVARMLLYCTRLVIACRPKVTRPLCSLSATDHPRNLLPTAPLYGCVYYPRAYKYLNSCSALLCAKKIDEFCLLVDVGCFEINVLQMGGIEIRLVSFVWKIREVGSFINSTHIFEIATRRRFLRSFLALRQP